MDREHTVPWDQRKEQVLQTIREANPDVLLLQEVSKRQWKDLSDALKGEYHGAFSGYDLATLWKVKLGGSGESVKKLVFDRHKVKHSIRGGSCMFGKRFWDMCHSDPEWTALMQEVCHSYNSDEASCWGGYQGPGVRKFDHNSPVWCNILGSKKSYKFSGEF